MAERSVITELSMRGFGSHRVYVVTCVLIKFCRDPGLIFLQYFKPNGYFQAIYISDWTGHCIIYVMSFVNSNQMMAGCLVQIYHTVRD